MKLLLDSTFNQDLLLLKIPLDFRHCGSLTFIMAYHPRVPRLCCGSVTTLITWFGPDFNTWRLVAVADFGTLNRWVEGFGSFFSYVFGHYIYIYIYIYAIYKSFLETENFPKSPQNSNPTTLLEPRDPCAFFSNQVYSLIGKNAPWKEMFQPKNGGSGASNWWNPPSIHPSIHPSHPIPSHPSHPIPSHPIPSIHLPVYLFFCCHFLSVLSNHFLFNGIYSNGLCRSVYLPTELSICVSDLI